ncbi:MAG: hypothetical protein IAI49_10250, partial [Candidatus Eremiobacteraeota bacterium]|nr:hypothetical protein [Candidatus Eremiobacteraeota bacterium]
MRRLGMVLVLLALWTSRSPAAGDSAYPPPIVVVYPFTVSGNTTDPRAGGNVALLLSTRLEQLGGVVVKPFTPGTSRADFLTAAKEQNADYYVTGFITPIGSEVSLITQVVSTYGGTVVWSSTVTIRTYSDALGQADGLRAAIVAHAERGLASLGSQPAPATSAAPSRDAADVNLTKALGRHHRNAAASAPPSAAPAAVLSAAPAAVPSAAPSPASVALGDRTKSGASKARKVLV